MLGVLKSLDSLTRLFPRVEYSFGSLRLIERKVHTGIDAVKDGIVFGLFWRHVEGRASEYGSREAENFTENDFSRMV